MHAPSTFYTYLEDKGDLLTVLTEHVVTDMIETGPAVWRQINDLHARRFSEND